MALLCEISYLAVIGLIDATNFILAHQLTTWQAIRWMVQSLNRVAPIRSTVGLDGAANSSA